MLNLTQMVMTRNEGEKVMAELSPLSWNVIRMKR